MQRFALITITLLAFLSVTCAAAATAPDENIIEVPFTFEKGHVIVQAKIKNNKPVEVIMATGAEHSMIDTEMLKKYDLPAYFSAEPPITGRNDKEFSFSMVPDIRVGEIKVTSLNMRFGPNGLGEVSARVGRPIFGILGADFFKGRIVKFDFRKKVIQFLRQSGADTSKDKMTSAATVSGRVVLPMSFYKEQVTLPIVENINFDGKKIKTLLDTGALTVISLSPSATKQLGMTPPAEKEAPRADKINSLRLNDYELKGVPVLLFAKGTGFDRDLKEFGAVIGSVFLQNFVVTFDFHDKLIILEHV